MLNGGYSHHYDKVGTLLGGPSTNTDARRFSTEKMKAWHVGRWPVRKQPDAQIPGDKIVSLDTALTVEHFPTRQSVERHRKLGVWPGGQAPFFARLKPIPDRVFSVVFSGKADVRVKPSP